MKAQSRQRRTGVRPHRTLWTAEAVHLIDAYQEQHQIPSFSAAAETLVRLGLQQSPIDVVTPIITSAVRQSIRRELERLIKLQLYTAIEAGIGQRLAGAAVRDIGRIKKDEPERADRIRQLATAQTRQGLGRAAIGEVIKELYYEFAPDEREPPENGVGVRGDHQE